MPQRPWCRSRRRQGNHRSPERMFYTPAAWERARRRFIFGRGIWTRLCRAGGDPRERRPRVSVLPAWTKRRNMRTEGKKVWNEAFNSIVPISHAQFARGEAAALPAENKCNVQVSGGGRGQFVCVWRHGQFSGRCLIEPRGLDGVVCGNAERRLVGQARRCHVGSRTPHVCPLGSERKNMVGYSEETDRRKFSMGNARVICNDTVLMSVL